jgi:hypothetical protein
VFSTQLPLHFPFIQFHMLRLVAVLWLATLIGCSRGDAPKTAPVRGAVSMGGQPLPNVGVTFLPTGTGPIATGNTDENGEFTLRTVNPGDGAPIGTHKVVLGRAEEGPAKPGSATIPQRYGRVDTTDLTADVKAGVKNVFSFEVKP